MAKRATLRDVPALTQNHQEFNCNDTLRGVTGVWSTGRLPAHWEAEYRHDRAEIVYTVVSYDTPIAWVKRDGTVVEPPVKYSVTTSKHQGKVRL